MSAVEKVELSGSQGTQTGFWAGQSPSRAGQKPTGCFFFTWKNFENYFNGQIVDFQQLFKLGKIKRLNYFLEKLEIRKTLCDFTSY